MDAIKMIVRFTSQTVRKLSVGIPLLDYSQFMGS
jgi:hypothetical protein